MEIIQIKVDVAGAKQALSQIQQVEKAVDSLAKKGKNVTVEINAKPLKDLKTEAEAAGNAGTVAAKKISDGMGSVEKSATDAGKSLSQLFSEITKWQILNAAVASTIRTFTNAVDTMQKVDDELVTVRKVTKASADELAKLKERAYETASAYGEAADEYLGFVSGFARAGYGKQAADLAELATKTKLVGDTNAETAQQFLLSVDAAYKYKGNIEALTKVLDGANEIDNRYATSIQAIAEGLGKVAPTAAMAGVRVDELTAAIGTITAVTQRSGTEAATALRAIFLNILGDTTTEIEEGVTWTTGEIKGLMDVLKQFAPEVVKTAEATGELINPMEAIGALAKAAKEDTTTASKIFSMINDIGGKLRTTQLVSLIENWDMYQSMLSDFGNAAGSADEEVSNALDSWTRKTKILQNEWTTLIENFLDTETVKTILDGLIVAVDALDTNVGHVAITVGGLALAVQSVAGAASGLSKLTGFLGIGSANPWVLGVLAAGAAVTGLAYAVDKANPSLEEINAKLNESSKQLEKNENRLKEINATNWTDLTPEILSERDALESENTELERQIKKYKDLAEVKGSHVNNKGTISVLGYQAKASGTVSEASRTDGTAGADTGLRTWTQSAATAKEAIDAATASLENAYQVMDGTIAATTKRTQVTLEGADAYNYLKSAANDLITTLDTKNALTADEVLTYNDLIKVMPQYIDYLAENGEQTGELEQLLDLLTAAYDRAAQPISDYVAGLLKVQRQAGKSGDQIYDLVKRMIVLNEKKLDLSQQIGALRQLASEAGAAAYSVGMIGAAKTQDVERTIKGLLQTGKAKTYDEARTIVLNRIYKSMFTDTGRDSGTVDTTPTGNTPPSTSSTGASKTDAELERLKDIVSLRKSELSLMQERGDSTADQIDKMRQIQAALHDQAEYMRKIGASQADINALSTEHWKITKQIKELQEDLWSELEDAVNKKLEEAEEARDKQTDAIDKQIAALKDAKEAEDESLKLEELKAAVLEKQNALLEAQKERTVRVFNAATGQWEWEANASSVKSAEDAYEKAKEDLAEYERELALQREIDELEAKKTLIEETYNTLKAEWKRITDSLQSPTRTIDDILSDIARNGTPKMRQQVEEVNTLLGKLNQYIAGTVNGGQVPGQPGEVPGTAGANGTAGGYYFDFNKNPGGGWTQAEMDEGFKNSGSSSSSSGWQLADGSSANLNYKDTTPVGNGTKLQYTGPDMSRDPKLAGKTVEKNGYVITYDENGYAKSAINVHQGAAGSKLSGKYPQVDADGNEMHYTGFNKDIDYTLAIQKAKEAGLGDGAIKQLETERQNKINALYGGKDPYKKYDSGGILRGLGGIKATSRDEIVIPPFLAEKMLEPSADSAFQKRMGELGWLYGAAERGSAMPGKTVMSRTSHDHYGDSYSVNGVQIGAEAANRLTIAQVMQALNHGAGNLGLYKH